MNITTVLALLFIGLLAGIASGLVGIGGGLIIVPALVMIPLFGMTQKMAQGTSLAMLMPPIGFLAVINYYKDGNVNFKFAAVLCISFIVGSSLGSKIALNLNEVILKKVFGCLLLVFAIKFLFFKK